MVGRSSQVMPLSKGVHHLDTGKGPTAAIGTISLKSLHGKEHLYLYIVSLDQHPPFCKLFFVLSIPTTERSRLCITCLESTQYHCCHSHLHVLCPSFNAKRHHVGVSYLNHPICGPPLIKPNISSHMTSLYTIGLLGSIHWCIILN